MRLQRPPCARGAAPHPPAAGQHNVGTTTTVAAATTAAATLPAKDATAVAPAATSATAVLTPTAAGVEDMDLDTQVRQAAPSAKSATAVAPTATGTAAALPAQCAEGVNQDVHAHEAAEARATTIAEGKATASHMAAILTTPKAIA